MSLFRMFKAVGEVLFGEPKTKEESEREIQRLREDRKRIKAETRELKPHIYFFEGGLIVNLTDSGYKKVGHRNIYSTEEQVRQRGAYLYVTDRESGKTYIFNPDTDIESIDQE